MCLSLLRGHRVSRAVCDYTRLLKLKACCEIYSMCFAGICRGLFFESGNHGIPEF